MTLTTTPKQIYTPTEPTTQANDHSPTVPQRHTIGGKIWYSTPSHESNAGVYWSTRQEALDYLNKHFN